MRKSVSNAIEELRALISDWDSGKRKHGVYIEGQVTSKRIIADAILELADRIKHIESRATFPTEGD